MPRRWPGLRAAPSATWAWARSSGLGTGRSSRRTKAWRFRGPGLWSAGIGLASGVAGYLAGPVVSAVALGLCGAAASAAYFLAAPFLRLARALRAQGS